MGGIITSPYGSSSVGMKRPWSYTSSNGPDKKERTKTQ